MLFSLGFCQHKSFMFGAKLHTFSPTLFQQKNTDSIKVISIETLGKLAAKDFFDSRKVNLSPKNYNWNLEMRRAESFKSMSLNIRQQDFCGRDLPLDIHSEVIQNIYMKRISYP